MPKVTDLNNPSDAILEHAKREIGANEVFLVNPWVKSEHLFEEAELRLDNVKEMLQDLGALGRNSAMMQEGYQGACYASSMLINDSLRLIRAARTRAKEEEAENA